ncbi:MAG: hypothetical protein ACTSRP_12515 [Candidatus Helarchaeota archaeon]
MSYLYSKHAHYAYYNYSNNSSYFGYSKNSKHLVISLILISSILIINCFIIWLATFKSNWNLNDNFTYSHNALKDKFHTCRYDKSNNNFQIEIEVMSAPSQFITTAQTVEILVKLIINDNIIDNESYEHISVNISIYKDGSFFKQLELKSIEDGYFFTSLKLSEIGKYSLTIEASVQLAHYSTSQLDDIYVFYFPLSFSHFIFIMLFFSLSMVILHEVSKKKIIKEVNMNFSIIFTFLISVYSVILFSFFIAGPVGYEYSLLFLIVGSVVYLRCKSDRKRVKRLVLSGLFGWIISCSILKVILIFTGFNAVMNFNGFNIMYVYSLYFFLQPWAYPLYHLVKIISNYQSRPKDPEIKKML